MTSILKLYFRELPIPIWTSKFHQRFLDASSNHFENTLVKLIDFFKIELPEQEAIEELKNLVSQLPVEHQAFLE